MTQLSDLYDADARTKNERIRRLAEKTSIPHPLNNVAYADGISPCPHATTHQRFTAGRAAYEAPAAPQGFWPQINEQLARIQREKPDTFDAVRNILLDPVYDDVVREVHRNFERRLDADSAFFAGSGGEATLKAALVSAGWHVHWFNAAYHYALVNERTGEVLTYIEGDVERGDRSEH